jgi:hypothetical protein
LSTDERRIFVSGVIVVVVVVVERRVGDVIRPCDVIVYVPAVYVSTGGGMRHGGTFSDVICPRRKCRRDVTIAPVGPTAQENRPRPVIGQRSTVLAE